VAKLLRRSLEEFESFTISPNTEAPEIYSPKYKWSGAKSTSSRQFFIYPYPAHFPTPNSRLCHLYFKLIIKKIVFNKKIFLNKKF